MGWNAGFGPPAQGETPPASADVVFSWADLVDKEGIANQRAIMRNFDTGEDAFSVRYSTILADSPPGAWVLDGDCEWKHCTDEMMPRTDRLDISRPRYSGDPSWQFTSDGLRLDSISPIAPALGATALTGLFIATHDLNWSKVKSIVGSCDWRGTFYDHWLGVHFGRNGGSALGQIGFGALLRTIPPLASGFFTSFWWLGRWAGDSSFSLGTEVNNPNLQPNWYIKQDFSLVKSWASGAGSEFTIARNGFEGRIQSISPGDPNTIGLKSGAFNELNIYANNGVGGVASPQVSVLRTLRINVNEYQDDNPYWPGV